MLSGGNRLVPEAYPAGYAGLPALSGVLFWILYGA
jgi:hypothetical protein